MNEKDKTRQSQPDDKQARDRQTEQQAGKNQQPSQSKQPGKDSGSQQR